ncbi:uncharacterized protein LOC129948926 [Eupeodes corollae]|uniref:uncharacterized protein LOC129948926 n=1 Tax=Eupeodes corollae TaxID=290404 RepID=UPI00248F4EF6|nr:uncharacterized protein LOC129948926 [Eupeodes corollae]
MNNVSPFLLQRVIAKVSGPIDQCTRLRDGKILLKTKTLSQANKLIKLKTLNPFIKISISEHETLNGSKGVAHCPQFNSLSRDEILDGLKDQLVIDFKRIKTKNPTNNKYEEGNLYIFHFSSYDLPKEISVCYDNIKIRPYIPAPLRCTTCLRFGHITVNCTAEKKCANCSQTFHSNSGEDEMEKCNRPPFCINYQLNHNALSTSCIKYVHEREVQKIKALERVSIKEAIKRHRERLQTSTSPPTTTIKNQNCQCRCTCKAKEKETTPKVSQKNNTTTTLAEQPNNVETNKRVKEAESASSLSTSSSNDQPPIKIIDTGRERISILPTKLSTRKKRELKKQNKTDKNNKMEVSSLSSLNLSDHE